MSLLMPFVDVLYFWPFPSQNWPALVEDEFIGPLSAWLIDGSKRLMCLWSADDSSALKSGNADDSSALHRHPGAATLCSRRCQTVVLPSTTSSPGHALASAATPRPRRGGCPPPACFSFLGSADESSASDEFKADDSSALHSSLAAACLARIISTQAAKFRRYPKEPRFAFIPRPGGLTSGNASRKYSQSFTSPPGAGAFKQPLNPTRLLEL